MNALNRQSHFVWHPCSQMKDYEDFPTLEIQSAKGSHLFLQNGKKVIDAISSWWCKSLGHQHPRLKKALQKQLNRFEHVISANIYQEPLIALSEKLSGFTPHLNKAFYAGDGSTAVEIAIKMSLHARKNAKQNSKTNFMVLKNAYHGESLLCLSLSDLSLYKKPYESLLIHFPKIHSIPYVNSIQDSAFTNCERMWQTAEKEIMMHAPSLSGIILEPILQAACGMQIYSADFLTRLDRLCKKHDIHLIADEIMTGCGRTGYPLACHYAKIEPDFICLSKGLSGGFLPISVVLTHSKIYDLFYARYESGKSFLHSNTMSGNALAAAVALECLTVLEEEHWYQQVQEGAAFLRSLMEDVETATKKIKNIRSIGAVVATDLVLSEEQSKQRMGWAIYKEAVKQGALLRPLGNCLYFAPPFNTPKRTLIKLRDITITSIKNLI